jgi:hypothetical protein
MLIVVWQSNSLEQFRYAYKDPYYLNVIQPDEHFLLDIEGLGQGVVAAFAGKVIVILEGGVSTIVEVPWGGEERRIWQMWEEGAGIPEPNCLIENGI